VRCTSGTGTEWRAAGASEVVTEIGKGVNDRPGSATGRGGGTDPGATMGGGKPPAGEAAGGTEAAAAAAAAAAKRAEER